MIAPKHVFISYARSDGHAVAQELNQLLWANSIPTWQDLRSIDPHQDFSAEIEMAIEAAMHVVVCLTPSIMERKDSFVRREIIYAQGVGVPITPLLFPGFSVDRIPVLINHYTWISFLDRSCPTSRNFEDGISQLLRRLRSSSITYRSFSAEADPFREYLHELYKNIVSYLDQTVFHLVHLHSESVADATQIQPKFRKHLTLGVFQTALPVRPPSEPEEESLVTYSNIPEAFQAAQNQLLVLGEPGAGKTTSLMAFARDAIAARLEDPTQPLPLLGRLADWVREGSPSIPTWLSSSLGLQENVVQEVLSKDSALLLFDGLDEIISIEEEGPSTADERRNQAGRPDYRKDFMREFKKCVNGNQAIVTCRATEYMAFRSKIALRGATRIRRLDDEQIMEYLSLDASLMAAIQSDSELREVIRNPLLLSFFAYAYQGQKEHADQLSNLRSAPGELLEHIFRNYVERRFEHEALRANCRLMTSISDTYAILGRAGVENQDFEITRLKTTLYQGSPLKECIERQIGDASSDFIEQTFRLNLLVQDEQQTLRFVHPLVRDHFALTFALGEYQKDTKKFSDQILLQVGALLAKIGDDRAITRLLEIGTIDGRIKEQFHFYLDDFNDPRVVRAYARSLSSTTHYYIYEWVRNDALNSLKKLSNKMGADNVARVLVDALSESSGQERSDYALALGLIRSSCCIEPLIGALVDPDPEVRACSAFALGQLGDERALPTLELLLNDQSFENRPYHTYPWQCGDTWDPRESRWDPEVHLSVGQIAEQAISEIRGRVSVRK